MFEESSSSSKILTKEVIKKSTSDSSFERSITINEQSSKKSSSEISFEESTSGRFFWNSSYQASPEECESMEETRVEIHAKCF